MAIIPALDLHTPSSDIDVPHVPANVEAEQALLGALLYDNGAYERIDERLRPEHFYEPFHQRLYAAIEGNIRKGMLAEPIVFAESFSRDPAFEELGGILYLADLVDRAPPSANAKDYAAVILDLALRRQLAEISQESAALAIGGADDVTALDMIERMEGQLYALAEIKSGVGVVSFADASAKAIRMAAEAFQRDGGLSGVSTGLIDLDQKIGGLHPSDLIIIAARPSMGKSALAFNIGHHVAKDYAYEDQPDGTRKTVRGGVVLGFSLEMSDDQLAMRIMASVAGVSGDRIRKGEIDPSEFGRVRDAAIELTDMPLYIDPTGGISIAKLASRARRQKRRTGLDLIIVDYIQLMDAGLKANASRVEQVTLITQGLKALAKELDVPIVALSQLSREVERRDDKRPQLSDLRDSGSIEQDADMVMFIYREEYYLERTEPRPGTEEHFKWQEQMDQCRGLAEVIVGKQRHGPIGTVRLMFNSELTKFNNLAPSGRYDGYGRDPSGGDR